MSRTLTEADPKNPSIHGVTYPRGNNPYAANHPASWERRFRTAERNVLRSAAVVEALTKLREQADLDSGMGVAPDRAVQFEDGGPLHRAFMEASMNLEADAEAYFSISVEVDERTNADSAPVDDKEAA